MALYNVTLSLAAIWVFLFCFLNIPKQSAAGNVIQLNKNKPYLSLKSVLNSLHAAKLYILHESKKFYTLDKCTVFIRIEAPSRIEVPPCFFGWR